LRFLAIDLGDRRTGFATGDRETSFVQPLEVAEAPFGPLLMSAILRVVERERPNAIVIGLPLNMDDTEGPAAARIRAFGSDVAARTSLPVHFQDERLTSHAAEHHLARSGKTRGQKKRIRDALAAAEILREFLHSDQRND